MSNTVVSGFPHVFRAVTVSGTYRRLCMAILVPVGWAVAQGGPPVFAMVLTVVVAAVLSDLLVTGFIAGAQLSVTDFRAVYFGLVAAALLPKDTGLMAAAIAGALTMLLGVWLFGGPGKYRVHPSLVGPGFAGIVFVGAGEVTGRTSALGEVLPSEIVSTVEHVLFEPLGVRISSEGWQLLLGMSGPEGGALVLGLVGPVLLGALIVFGEDLLPLSLPASFLATYALVVWWVGGLPASWGGGDPLNAVFLTNALFVTVFLAADPAVRPVSLIGTILFGIGTGLLAAVLWITGVSNAPVVVAFFLSGIFVPLLDGLTSGRL